MLTLLLHFTQVFVASLPHWWSFHYKLSIRIVGSLTTYNCTYVIDLLFFVKCEILWEWVLNFLYFHLCCQYYEHRSVYITDCPLLISYRHNFDNSRLKIKDVVKCWYPKAPYGNIQSLQWTQSLTHCLQHTAYDIITSTLHDVLCKSLMTENYNIIYFFN